MLVGVVSTAGGRKHEAAEKGDVRIVMVALEESAHNAQMGCRISIRDGDSPMHRLTMWLSPLLSPCWVPFASPLWVVLPNNTLSSAPQPTCSVAPLCRLLRSPFSSHALHRLPPTPAPPRAPHLPSSNCGLSPFVSQVYVESSCHLPLLLLLLALSIPSGAALYRLPPALLLSTPSFVSLRHLSPRRLAPLPLPPLSPPSTASLRRLVATVGGWMQHSD